MPSLLLENKRTSDNVLITDELRHDLNRIYDLLIRYGVTADEIAVYRRFLSRTLRQSDHGFLNRLDQMNLDKHLNY